MHEVTHYEPRKTLFAGQDKQLAIVLLHVAQLPSHGSHILFELLVTVMLAGQAAMQEFLYKKYPGMHAEHVVWLMVHSEQGAVQSKQLLPEETVPAWQEAEHTPVEECKKILG